MQKLSLTMVLRFCPSLVNFAHFLAHVKCTFDQKSKRIKPPFCLKTLFIFLNYVYFKLCQLLTFASLKLLFSNSTLPSKIIFNVVSQKIDTKNHSLKICQHKYHKCLSFFLKPYVIPNVGVTAPSSSFCLSPLSPHCASQNKLSSKK